MKITIKNSIKYTISILMALAIILVPTIYKVLKHHNDNLKYVVDSLISEEAEKCFIEKKCQNDETTLQELYQYHYLEKVSDPVTKRLYSPDSKIAYKDNKIELHLK